MKPKYSLLKNAKYALDGLIFMLKNEISFRIEIFCSTVLTIISFFLPTIDIATHILLVMSLFLILIMECVNSAIESCIDLITPEFAKLAKIAKDCGSASVFLSVILAIIIWSIIFLKIYIF